MGATVTARRGRTGKPAGNSTSSGSRRSSSARRPRSEPAKELLAALQQVAHHFGARARQQKLRLLRRTPKAERPSAPEMIAFQDVLGFMRAYADGPDVRAAADAAVRQLRSWVDTLAPDSPTLTNTGLPGTSMAYSFHYGVLRQLLRAWPGSCEIDWQELEDEGPLMRALSLSIPAAEGDGLDDDRLTLQQWLAGCRPAAAASDLETAIGIVSGAGHSDQLQASLFDASDLPTRYALHSPGQGRCELSLPGGQRCYQREDIERDKYPLSPLIEQPLPAVRPCSLTEARTLLKLSHSALCSRLLEIYPLIYANERDVMRITCKRGIEVVLVGTRPTMRAALETLYFFLVVKNGVPIAYGPTGVFLGACEMGINLFPEFRGAEIRYVYGQVMRVLRHVLGADYFFLQAYGMGVDNPDAIASGAFWFYRKLGFAAENPAVERLAQKEELRMRDQPGYRSDRRMLHRLKHTRAYLDLSRGRSSRFDFARLGVRLSEFVGREHGGDRERAATDCAAAVARAIGLRRSGLSTEQRRALQAVAPILAMVPDLSRWSPAEKRSLARVLQLKGGVSEAPACRAMARHARLRRCLRALINDQPAYSTDGAVPGT